MTKAMWQGLAAAIVVAATAAACGGGSSTPTTPTRQPPTPPPTTGPNPTTATITIGTDGRVTPASVTIAPGGRVTMINNHNQLARHVVGPASGAHAVPGDQPDWIPDDRSVAHVRATSTPRGPAASTITTCRITPACRAGSSFSRQVDLAVQVSGRQILLTATEVRLPFLEIGLQAFLRIVALEQPLLQLALEREALAET